MKEVISVRQKHPAFHPFGGQKAYDIDDKIFCLVRWDPNETERILVLANLTNKPKTVNLQEHSLPVKNGNGYNDIISGKQCISNGVVKLTPFKVVWVKV